MIITGIAHIANFLIISIPFTVNLSLFTSFNSSLLFFFILFFKYNSAASPPKTVPESATDTPTVTLKFKRFIAT